MIKKVARIKTLDGIKVIATLGIFLFHCTGLIECFPAIRYFSCFVTAFFILSGWSFVTWNYNNPSNEKLSYLKYMLKKIYGMYISSQIVVVFIESIKHGSLIYKKKLLINALMIQSWIPNDNIYFGLNGVTWYISSLFFCLTMAGIIGMQWIKKKSLVTIRGYLLSVLIIQVVYNLVVTYFYSGTSFSAWLLYVFPLARFCDFAIGVLSACIYVKRTEETKEDIIGEGEKWKWTIVEIATIVVFIFIYLMAFNTKTIITSGCYWSIILAVVIYVFSYQKGVLSHMLIFLAKYSKYAFPFYLFHQIVIMNFCEIAGTRTAYNWIGSFIISCLISYTIIRLKVKFQSKIKKVEYK